MLLLSSPSSQVDAGFTTAAGIDHYPHHHHHHPHDLFMNSRAAGEASDENNNHTNIVDNNIAGTMDYSLNISASFADVMHFADFGPKLALNQTGIPEEEEPGIDSGFFLKFPVLGEKIIDQDHQVQQPLRAGDGVVAEERGEDEEATRVLENASVQLRFLGDEVDNRIGSSSAGPEAKNKRKRPRTTKTTEEVESQRMTHIAVERNRRRQMNEHLRVLRTLMPGSYVQRGDQASIIGGAIEFVRELEQLLQCLESQKRRRMLGDQSTSMAAAAQHPPPPQQPFFGFEGGVLQEETAENKSCVADVEVKLVGLDAMIKVLSRRRPGQLVKAIAALQDLHLNILHTNITTIEQTVLYSFNVKIGGETRFNAEDIATSVQQIFTFIHANTGGTSSM